MTSTDIYGRRDNTDSKVELMIHPRKDFVVDLLDKKLSTIL